jgi:hypothetical protein
MKKINSLIVNFNESTPKHHLTIKNINIHVSYEYKAVIKKYDHHGEIQITFANHVCPLSP